MRGAGGTAGADGPRGGRPTPPEDGPGRPDAEAPPGDLEAPEDLEALEDLEDLYENAPCGFLSTRPDGTIIKINNTLLNWLGRTRGELLGRRRFTDLLTVGGRLYHETHFAPLLRMQGEIGGIALELRRADGGRLPVLVTSVIRPPAGDGRPAVVRTTVFDAHDRRSYERELLRARREADQERDRLQELVATLQRSLLPPALPEVPGVEAAAHYRIASPDRVGGDFYDLFPLQDGRWGFFLGDVSGKGPEAATVTSLIRYTLRAAAETAPDLPSVLRTLNSAVLHQDHVGSHARFCTVVYGELVPDGDGVVLTLASGGHPPALLLHADASATYRCTPGGMLVGVTEDAEFAATTARLAPGDTLLLYTDGLTEARTDDSGGRYGEDALHAFAAGLAPARPAAVVEAVSDLLTRFGEGLEDDTAVLALGVPPREQAVSASGSPTPGPS